MNKKLNTILFILCATIFNIIVAVISFFVFFLLYAKFIMPIIAESGYQWGLTLVLIAAIAVSIGVYRIVLRFLLDKIEIEKYFDPLFVSKYRKPKPPSQV